MSDLVKRLRSYLEPADLDSGWKAKFIQPQDIRDAADTIERLHADFVLARSMELMHKSTLDAVKALPDKWRSEWDSKLPTTREYKVGRSLSKRLAAELDAILKGDE